MEVWHLVHWVPTGKDAEEPQHEYWYSTSMLHCQSASWQLLHSGPGNYTYPGAQVIGLRWISCGLDLRGRTARGIGAGRGIERRRLG